MSGWHNNTDDTGTRITSSNLRMVLSSRQIKISRPTYPMAHCSLHSIHFVLTEVYLNRFCLLRST